MNAIQHAVALPPDEIVVDCAARRKILRKVAPLAVCAQDIHDPVYDRAHVGLPLAATASRWRNERFDKRPLVVRQVARVSQLDFGQFGRCASPRPVQAKTTAGEFLYGHG